MIEDMRHLAVFDAHQREIRDTIIHYNGLASGETDKLLLIQIYIEQNEALCEILKKQHRALRWMRGDKVESVNHEVEAHIIGEGGLVF